MHFEQFDVVHDDSSNASSDSNYEASLYTCHIVKSIVLKSNVDEPCATSRIGVVEGKFDYEIASRKPCSKS